MAFTKDMYVGCRTALFIHTIVTVPTCKPASMNFCLSNKETSCNSSDN